jgi:hypothetical protein
MALVVATGAVGQAGAGGGGGSGQGETRPYLLDASSSFVFERCLPPCACPTGAVTSPLRGGFDLRLIAVGDVFDFYEVSLVALASPMPGGAVTTLVGSGTYRVSTVAGLHGLTLDLSVNGGAAERYESGVVGFAGRGEPFIDLSAATAVSGCERRTVRLLSGPACVADFNLDGLVNPDDLSDYITAYFLLDGPDRLDVDGNGVVNPDDLADFIARYFDGCA